MKGKVWRSFQGTRMEAREPSTAASFLKSAHSCSLARVSARVFHIPHSLSEKGFPALWYLDDVGRLSIHAVFPLLRILVWKALASKITMFIQVVLAVLIPNETIIQQMPAPMEFFEPIVGPVEPRKLERVKDIVASAEISSLRFCVSPLTIRSPSSGTILKTMSFALKASPKVPSPIFLMAFRLACCSMRSLIDGILSVSTCRSHAFGLF